MIHVRNNKFLIPIKNINTILLLKLNLQKCNQSNHFLLLLI